MIPNPELPAWAELRLVMPEIWLVLGMCAVVLTPFAVGRGRRLVPATALVTLATLALALVATLMSMSWLGGEEGRLFYGMLTVDPFSQFFKVLVLVFTALIVLQWSLLGRAETDGPTSPDFFCLLLGAVTGMMLMASASNLLMIVLAIESASLPSYVLAGMHKEKLRSSEGSLKYVLFGAAATTITVYGLSLIYGATGTLDLQGVAQSAVAQGEAGRWMVNVSPLFAAGLVGMMAGIAFKLSAAPAHFWCPDVFEGAPFEIATFLSVASKGAAVALLLRVMGAFGAAGMTGEVAFSLLCWSVAAVGMLTATWGNAVAIQQTNIKRLLAYSSIGHAGYMIMAVSVAGRLGSAEANEVARAVLYYLVVYLFMNLGAFTVAGLVARGRGKAGEDIRGYAGMVRRSPWLAVAMGVFLLSLFGMPGLGGFMAKVYLGLAMLRSDTMGFALVAVLLVNTVVSLYVYLRPAYFMFVAREEDAVDVQPGGAVELAGAARLLLAVCVAGILWTGLELGASALIKPFGVLRGTTAPVEIAAEAGQQ